MFSVDPQEVSVSFPAALRDGRCHMYDLHASKVWAVYDTQMEALGHLNEWGWEQDDMVVGETREIYLIVFLPNGRILIDDHPLECVPRKRRKRKTVDA